MNCHTRPTLTHSLLSCLFALTFSQLAHAQTMVPKLDGEGRKADVARIAKQRALEKFDAADLDKDGKLSKEEVGKALPYLAETFTQHDKNNDGFLSWEEYVGHDRWPR
jgi:hypothetical protein